MAPRPRRHIHGHHTVGCPFGENGLTVSVTHSQYMRDLHFDRMSAVMAFVHKHIHNPVCSDVRALLGPAVYI